MKHSFGDYVYVIVFYATFVAVGLTMVALGTRRTYRFLRLHGWPIVPVWITVVLVGWLIFIGGWLIMLVYLLLLGAKNVMRRLVSTK